MGIVSDILRRARERDRRVGKARSAIAALTFEEKGFLLAELLRELKAGPPKPVRRRRSSTVPEPAKAERKTVRDRVVEALSQASPLNVAGIHAVIERTAPGAVSKSTVAAEVSSMFGKGLLVKAGSSGRGSSFAIANGHGGAQ